MSGQVALVRGAVPGPTIVVAVLIYIPASYLVGSSLCIVFTKSISEIQ
jgi:hypothetical protein